LGGGKYGKRVFMLSRLPARFHHLSPSTSPSSSGTPLCCDDKQEFNLIDISRRVKTKIRDELQYFLASTMCSLASFETNTCTKKELRFLIDFHEEVSKRYSTNGASYVTLDHVLAYFTTVLKAGDGHRTGEFSYFSHIVPKHQIKELIAESNCKNFLITSSKDSSFKVNLIQSLHNFYKENGLLGKKIVGINFKHKDTYTSKDNSFFVPEEINSEAINVCSESVCRYLLYIFFLYHKQNYQCLPVNYCMLTDPDMDVKPPDLARQASDRSKALSRSMDLYTFSHLLDSHSSKEPLGQMLALHPICVKAPRPEEVIQELNDGKSSRAKNLQQKYSTQKRCSLSDYIQHLPCYAELGELGDEDKVRKALDDNFPWVTFRDRVALKTSLLGMQKSFDDTNRPKPIDMSKLGTSPSPTITPPNSAVTPPFCLESQQAHFEKAIEGNKTIELSPSDLESQPSFHLAFNEDVDGFFLYPIIHSKDGNRYSLEPIINTNYPVSQHSNEKKQVYQLRQIGFKEMITEVSPDAFSDETFINFLCFKRSRFEYLNKNFVKTFQEFPKNIKDSFLTSFIKALRKNLLTTRPFMEYQLNQIIDNSEFNDTIVLTPKNHMEVMNNVFKHYIPFYQANKSIVLKSKPGNRFPPFLSFPMLLPIYDIHVDSSQEIEFVRVELSAFYVDQTQEEACFSYAYIFQYQGHEHIFDSDKNTLLEKRWYKTDVETIKTLLKRVNPVEFRNLKMSFDKLLDIGDPDTFNSKLTLLLDQFLGGGDSQILKLSNPKKGFPDSNKKRKPEIAQGDLPSGKMARAPKPAQGSSNTSHFTPIQPPSSDSKNAEQKRERTPDGFNERGVACRTAYPTGPSARSNATGDSFEEELLNSVLKAEDPKRMYIYNLFTQISKEYTQSIPSDIRFAINAFHQNRQNTTNIVLVEFMLDTVLPYLSKKFDNVLDPADLKILIEYLSFNLTEHEKTAIRSSHSPTFYNTFINALQNKCRTVLFMTPPSILPSNYQESIVSQDNLKVVWTPEKGFGVYAKQQIMPGVIIGRYSGKIFQGNELDQLKQAKLESEKPPISFSYIYHHKDSDKSKEFVINPYNPALNLTELDHSENEQIKQQLLHYYNGTHDFGEYKCTQLENYRVNGGEGLSISALINRPELGPDANCQFVMINNELFVVSKRPIEKGTELTLCYGRNCDI
tara:strand:+ start:2189 stop:5740 length:3552 start_codon:yes stop_codon:yes gene_type:complete